MRRYGAFEIVFDDVEDAKAFANEHPGGRRMKATVRYASGATITRKHVVLPPEPPPRQPFSMDDYLPTRDRQIALPRNTRSPHQ